MANEKEIKTYSVDMVLDVENEVFPHIEIGYAIGTDERLEEVQEDIVDKSVDEFIDFLKELGGVSVNEEVLKEDLYKRLYGISISEIKE